MCLRHQLELVNSSCPMILVYNDKAPLPLKQLEDTFGRQHLLPLSHLVDRYHLYDSEHTKHLKKANSSLSGRRLFEGSAGVANTHQKLWLWALPIPRAVFLDIDMLVLRNIDSLFAVSLPKSTIPGIATTTCKSKYGSRFFNSGLVVFEPSLLALRSLLKAERWVNEPWHGHIAHDGERWVQICGPMHDPQAAARLFPNSSNPLRSCREKYGPGHTPSLMPKACESKYTDQSVFNFVFSRLRTPIPHVFNDYNYFDLNQSRVVHFVGEPKPWNKDKGRSQVGSRHEASQLWRQRCAAALE